MTKEINTIITSNAPHPAGHYVQAIVAGDIAYISGQLPVSADGRHNPEAPFEDQVRQALANLLAIIEASGSRPDHILKITAYIVGVENWGKFNGLFAEAMGEHKPARTVISVPELHYGYLIEIDAIALVA